jgi:hypothetical protein
MMAQTSVATAAQQVTVHVTGGLSARVVHVWSTNLRGPGQFIQRGDIIPHQGAFAALLQPGYVYTFTTTTGQSRAVAPIPFLSAVRRMNLLIRANAISGRSNGEPTEEDARRRPATLCQLAGITSYTGRRSATVRLRLTSVVLLTGN